MSEPTKSPDGNREKVRAEVVDIISNRLGVGKEQITDATTFQEDLGADSLDVVELVMELEEKFKIQIPDEEAEKIKTVGAAVEYVVTHQK
jgi:acyl carrier protein